MHDERVSERSSVEEGQIVMPFYLVCDVSYSMSDDMQALNSGLDQLRRAIATQPVVDDVARISIITFSDSARVVMPLSQTSETSTPALAPEGGTDYGSAFRELARVIEDDRQNLKRQGYKIFRPCAFFLSDGEPLDGDWEQTFRRTLTYDKKTGTGMKAHPIFVPFGFRDAPEQALRKLAYPPERGKWYHARNTGVEKALEGILDVIMKTVVSSGLSVAPHSKPTLVLEKPSRESGITRGDSDYDEDYI
ncbi:VWA domain-containing protein [Planomonospora corallina]|uniref:VWA domain-containing protein n=1 Tax=Planomonospora corallina TaxID=1806052 RepID=A0ABV8IG40_9ACTN